MADSSVAVTPGTGAAIDTRTTPGGEHRQVMVIGDPTTDTVATVGAEGGLWVVPKGGVRYNVAIVYEGYSVTAADALVPITSRSMAVGTGVTTAYTVTAGRTFRIQQILASVTLIGATVAATRIRLRANAAGAAALTSPIQASWRIGNWSVGTQAANYTQISETLPIPDGMEFAAGTGIAMSAVATTAAMHSLDLTIIGYEY